MDHSNSSSCGPVWPDRCPRTSRTQVSVCARDSISGGTGLASPGTETGLLVSHLPEKSHLTAHSSRIYVGVKFSARAVVPLARVSRSIPDVSLFPFYPFLCPQPPMDFTVCGRTCHFGGFVDVACRRTEQNQHHAGGGTISPSALNADVPGPTAVVEDTSGNIYVAPPSAQYVFPME